MRYKNFKQWFKNEIWKKENIVYIIIAEVIFWSPAIFCAIMAIFDVWWLTGLSAYVAFWALPIVSPAIALQLGLFILIKKLFERKTTKSGKKS